MLSENRGLALLELRPVSEIFVLQTERKPGEIVLESQSFERSHRIMNFTSGAFPTGERPTDLKGGKGVLGQSTL